MVFDYMVDPTVDFNKYNFVWGTSEELLPTLKANNSRIVTSKYIPWNRDPNGKSSLYWKRNNPDWILYRCDRRSIAYLDDEPHISLDFSNPQFIEWQYKKFAVPASKSNFDAMAIDNFSFNNDAEACGIWKNGKWVQKYTGKLYDPVYANDARNWLKQFQSYVRSISPTLGLGVNFSLDIARNATSPEVQDLIDMVDYVVDEKGFSNWGLSMPEEHEWIRTHQFAEAVQRKGKAYFSINEFNKVTQENKEWAIASYLMSNLNRSSVVVVGVQKYGYETYLPEYASMNIGFPLGVRTKSKDIYYRSYTNGVVIANPNNAFRTVQLSGAPTRDVYGTVHLAGSSISLPPFSGKVLTVYHSPQATTLPIPTTQPLLQQPTRLPAPSRPTQASLVPTRSPLPSLQSPLNSTNARNNTDTTNIAFTNSTNSTNFTTSTKSTTPAYSVNSTSTNVAYSTNFTNANSTTPTNTTSGGILASIFGNLGSTVPRTSTNTSIP